MLSVKGLQTQNRCASQVCLRLLESHKPQVWNFWDWTAWAHAKQTEYKKILYWSSRICNLKHWYLIPGTFSKLEEWLHCQVFLSQITVCQTVRQNIVQRKHWPAVTHVGTRHTAVQHCKKMPAEVCQPYSCSGYGPVSPLFLSTGCSNTDVNISTWLLKRTFYSSGYQSRILCIIFFSPSFCVEDSSVHLVY